MASDPVTNIFQFNGTDPSNNTLTNLTGTTDGTDFGGSSSSNSTEGRDLMEFVGFISWYVLLVVCCVVPPCLAYRRRRNMDRQADERHPYLQQLADYGLIMLQHEHRNAELEEHDRQMRSRNIAQLLEQTTMVVKVEDMIEKEDQDDVDIEMFEDSLAVADRTMIQLGSDMPNGNRQVPAVCAICLCPYEVDDTICISPNEKCVHAFHTECAITWLSKSDETKCPCCRQDFCNKETINHNSHSSSTSNDSSSSDEDEETAPITSSVLTDRLAESLDDWSDDESHRI